MDVTYIFLTGFLILMVGIYFLPYRKLRGKIFKKLIYAKPLTAQYIQFKSSTFEVTAERVNGHTWRTTTPSVWLADKHAIMKLILRLMDLDVIDRITNGANDPQFGLGKHGEITLIFDKKKIIITMGIDVNGADEIYLNIPSADQDILTVSNSIKNFFPKSAIDFQKMSVFNAKYSDVRSIEAVFDNFTFMLSRQTNGWLLKSNVLFDDNVRPLIEEIITTKAEGFLTTKIKLPPKPNGVIMFKLLKDKTITRCFFNDINNEDQYLIPIEGTILYIKKYAIDTLFQNK